MPIPTPFHNQIKPLVQSYAWKDWAGYYAVRSFDTYMEREYHAFRQTAGVIDVTPLFKYDVTGKDAAAFLSRIMVKNIENLKLGQVTYCCWCDDHGKVVDDGTVWKITEDTFRVTAAEPCFFWLERYKRGFDVAIEDVSNKVAALSIQGPKSREILSGLVDGDLAKLKFFCLMQAKAGGVEAFVTRTGYTGDLGYEVWVANRDAETFWTALMEAGRPYGLLPCGLDAMDITRVEAGFLMNGVDYFSAHHCLIENRKSTPYELALGWTVNLDRDPFNGQTALRREKAEGVKRHFVGLALDWDEYEALFEAHGLPPQVPGHAWRDPVPVYDASGKRQVGQATSGAWSPMLKKNLALATVDHGYHKLGTRLRMEVTAEYERRTVQSTVAKKPFFDPERKRA